MPAQRNPPVRCGRPDIEVVTGPDAVHPAIPGDGAATAEGSGGEVVGLTVLVIRLRCGLGVMQPGGPAVMRTVTAPIRRLRGSA